MSDTFIDDIVSNIINAAIAAVIGSQGGGQEEAGAATSENGQVRDQGTIRARHDFHAISALKPLLLEICICNFLPAAQSSLLIRSHYHIIGTFSSREMYLLLSSLPRFHRIFHLRMNYQIIGRMRLLRMSWMNPNRGTATTSIGRSIMVPRQAQPRLRISTGAGGRPHPRVWSGARASARVSLSPM